MVCEGNESRLACEGAEDTHLNLQVALPAHSGLPGTGAQSHEGGFLEEEGLGPAPTTGRRSAVRGYGGCHRMQAPAGASRHTGGVASRASPVEGTGPSGRGWRLGSGSFHLGDGAVQQLPCVPFTSRGGTWGRQPAGGAGGRGKAGRGRGGGGQRGRQGLDVGGQRWGVGFIPSAKGK